MKKQQFLLCVISFSALFFPITVKALDVHDLENSKITEAFSDSLLRPLMSANHSPSGAISIVKDGKVIFTKGYGFQNIEKQIRVEPDKTLFRFGSVSKLFTWVAVMQLVEQGKLDLNVDVNTYLKAFQIDDTFPGQPITMRHIMTHTAGFEDGGMGHLIIKDIEKALPLAEAMAKYQRERVNAPGLQAAYSNYGAALAGLIVANISGMEFSNYIKKNIFDILGMASASFKEPLPTRLNENMAVAYAYEDERHIAQPFEILANVAPAGSMSATVTDMTKFAQAILNGGVYEGNRILKEVTANQMLARSFTHNDRLPAMALGFYETDQNGHRVTGHDGDTMYFHSDLTIDLKNDIALVSSFSGANGANISKAVPSAFYDTFFPVVQTRLTPPPNFSEYAEKYEGAYNFWRSNFSGIERASKLSGGFSVSATESNTLIISGFGEFVEIDRNLFQQMHGLMKVAFQENDAGDITGFVVDFAPFVSMYKVPLLENAGINKMLLFLSFLAFIGVFLKRLYQRTAYHLLQGAEKTAARASFLVASSNLMVLVIGALVIMSAGSGLFIEIPLSFKIWLVFPILAVLAGLYQAYNTLLVWRDGLCGSLWARVRYTILAFCALFMCWFYYFWNILGFQYGA